MRTPLRPIGLAVLVLSLLPTLAGAQFRGFTAPGALGQFRVAEKEALDSAMADARWKIGRLRLDPRLEISRVGYVANVFAEADDREQTDDFRASVGAGLTGYLALGPKARLSAFASGSYDWWQDTDELREFSPSVGVGLFGYFNRLTISARVTRLEGEAILANELEVPVQLRNDLASVEWEVRATGKLALFGVAAETRTRNSGAAEEFVTGLDLDTLDRDAGRTSLGVKLVSGRGWSVGVGGEIAETEFEVDQRRDNEATSSFVTIDYDGGRLRAEATAFNRDLDFPNQPALDRQGLVSGAARLEWRWTPRTSTGLYGGRELSFAARDADAYLIANRYGFRLGYVPGERWSASLLAERGDESFQSSGEFAGREDEYEAVGASVGLDLTERFRLTLSLTDSTYNSNLDEFDRSSLRVGFALEMKGSLTAF